MKQIVAYFITWVLFYFYFLWRGVFQVFWWKNRRPNKCPGLLGVYKGYLYCFSWQVDMRGGRRFHRIWNFFSPSLTSLWDHFGWGRGKSPFFNCVLYAVLKNIFILTMVTFYYLNTLLKLTNYRIIKCGAYPWFSVLDEFLRREGICGVCETCQHVCCWPGSLVLSFMCRFDLVSHTVQKKLGTFVDIFIQY